MIILPKSHTLLQDLLHNDLSCPLSPNRALCKETALLLFSSLYLFDSIITRDVLQYLIFLEECFLQTKTILISTSYFIDKSSIAWTANSNDLILLSNSVCWGLPAFALA